MEVGNRATFADDSATVRQTPVSIAAQAHEWRLAFC